MDDQRHILKILCFDIVAVSPGVMRRYNRKHLIRKKTDKFYLFDVFRITGYRQIQFTFNQLFYRFVCSFEYNLYLYVRKFLFEFFQYRWQPVIAGITLGT